jgi:phospholipase C
MRGTRRWRSAALAGLGVACADGPTVAVADSGGAPTLAAGATTTPIKHMVVIFQENVSFDHYFGTTSGPGPGCAGRRSRLWCRTVAGTGRACRSS